MLRRVAITAAIVLVAAGFVVPASGGSRHILVGLYDDAQVLGYPARTFPRQLIQHRRRTTRTDITHCWVGHYAEHGSYLPDRRANVGLLENLS